MGYVLQPGGRWKGDFLAAKLSEFATGVEDGWRSVSTHRVCEVVLPADKLWEFSLKAVYDERRRLPGAQPPYG